MEREKLEPRVRTEGEEQKERELLESKIEEFGNIARKAYEEHGSASNALYIAAETIQGREKELKRGEI